MGAITIHTSVKSVTQTAAEQMCLTRSIMPGIYFIYLMYIGSLSKIFMHIYFYLHIFIFIFINIYLFLYLFTYIYFYIY